MIKIELPMLLEMDNTGAVENATSGRLELFLHELEQGLLTIKHILGDNNDADIFTKI